jgi:hypothetical protein
MATATMERVMTKRNDVSVKMDAEVADECRIAAAHKGMTLAEYLSESMRVVSARDIDEALARRTAKRQAPKGKGKGE